MLSPRENPTLVGHEENVRLFLDLIHRNKLPHGWILAGDFGIGKATFAFHMARYLISGRTNGDLSFSETDPLFRRIATRSDAHLWTMGGDDSEDMSVDSVRELNAFLTHTSSEGTFRVVIIDGADRLNRNGANALLKRLEEPPLKTIFFLITSLPGHLLPTIRSRCQLLSFSPLSELDVKKVLAAQDFSMPTFAELSPGSPGRLIRLLEGEGETLHSDLQKVLKGENPLKFIQTYGDNENFYHLIEDLLRTFLYNRLIKEVNQKEKIETMLPTYETIDRLFTQCRFSQLDKKTTLACVLGEITK